MQDLKTVKIKKNTEFFGLAPWVGKNSTAIQMLREFVKSRDYSILETLKRNGALLSHKEHHNIIVTVGRNVLTRLLTGDGTYTGEITYGALGSGTTAFTNASTQLNTEVYRKITSSASFDDNIAYVDFFIASGDVADQTFEEWATFIDGAAGADTGQAFSLLITGGWTKSGSMFISSKYTIT